MRWRGQSGSIRPVTVFMLDRQDLEKSAILWWQINSHLELARRASLSVFWHVLEKENCTDAQVNYSVRITMQLWIKRLQYRRYEFLMILRLQYLWWKWSPHLQNVSIRPWHWRLGDRSTFDFCRCGMPECIEYWWYIPFQLKNSMTHLLELIIQSAYYLSEGCPKFRLGSSNGFKESVLIIFWWRKPVLKPRVRFAFACYRAD